jgi:glycerophosphoryl diester phosphodiesterase
MNLDNLVIRVTNLLVADLNATSTPAASSIKGINGALSMQTHINILLASIILASSVVAQVQAAEPSSTQLSADKIVIAHRGASGYLPEHSLPAKAMAYAQGADYLEQDLVMTKDNELVVLHDHYLDRVTDVADRLPDRARKDGRYYAIDFTLPEIKSLKFTEGFDIDKNGKKVQSYPGRFPMGKSDFRVHTFQEEIEFIQGLNHSTGKNVGIYPEIKAPWFHQQEGKDISTNVLEVLKQYGYTTKGDKVYLQCFDANELKRIKNELEPKMVWILSWCNWWLIPTGMKPTNRNLMANGLTTATTGCSSQVR